MAYRKWGRSREIVNSHWLRHEVMAASILSVDELHRPCDGEALNDAESASAGKRAE